jgi:outer membrane protein OmpA-like peptidoglycan-associated protein
MWLRKALFVGVILFAHYKSASQSVLWANKVVAFSSEYSDQLLGKEFRAIHALGRPSKYPKFGNSPSAWQSLTPDSPNGEYIIVSFDSLMHAKQIAIFENFGAGSITQVEAFDVNNKLYLLRDLPANYAVANGQITRIKLNTPTPFLLKSLKITLNSERVKGFSQIDAIAISADDKPIESSIALEKDANAYLVKENLGFAINSKFNEICPVVSPDGKSLFFTRWKHPDNLGAAKNQDIWVSQLGDDKKWMKASLFPAPINNDENNAVCGISPNGKTMLLNNVYGKDGQMEKGVSLSFKLRTGDWSFPKPIRIQNFKNKSEYSEYTLAPNGKVLMMTTETKDSYGGKDIYVSFLKSDDTWTEPKNIGSNVNSGESESTPFIAPDGVTMYFSSSGHVGYGNNDIFLTRRLDDTWLNWSIPENVGPVVNTNQWDGYFSVSAQGEYAYFSSVENSMGAEDIYRIKMPDKVKPQTLVQLAGKVVDASSKLALNSKIIVRSTIGLDTMSVDYDPYLGDFSFMWPAKTPFQVEVKSKGYVTKRESFDFRKETKFVELSRNFSLIPLEVNKQFNLPTLNFAQSKSEIQKESFDALDGIVSILQDNQSYHVLIEGHTDLQGDWNENLQLSVDRAVKVKEYLMSKGISSSRIQTKGWGGTKPVSSSTLEDKRRLNRRVEFTLFIGE